MQILKRFYVSVAIMVGMVWMVCCSLKHDDKVQSVRIRSIAKAGLVAQRASEILAREITERSGAKIFKEGKAEFTIELSIAPGIGTEGFTISGNGDRSVKITGNDERGLLYGVGKFLHTSQYEKDGFSPGTWRGTDTPKGTFRGIYFATHFNNWYEEASDTERQRYVESLALWGVNSLVVHFPNQWMSGYDDPKAVAWFRKIKAMMRVAKSVGIKVGILQCVNTSFTSAPKQFYATTSRRCWGQILCPSIPAARQLLLNDWSRLLDEFSDIGLDFVTYWPYDEGGCACAQCAPWGSNGYAKLCKDFSGPVRQKYPQAKIILSTWFFDQSDTDNVQIVYKEDGEYAGLFKLLAKDKSWVDCIMTDAHRDFPEYIQKHGSPGGLPMVNFPEISMWGQRPWGGYGANPLPNRFQRLWSEVKGKVVGGFPYSEGIYEDINKIICARFYWNPNIRAEKTVKEYIAYEFSPAVVDSVWKAIQIFEQNHHRTKIGESAKEAFRLVKQADAQLTTKAKTSWRWRMIYLRAQIDNELFRTGGRLEGQTLKSAFEEVTRISHAENANQPIKPLKITDANAKGELVPEATW